MTETSSGDRDTGRTDAGSAVAGAGPAARDPERPDPATDVPRAGPSTDERFRLLLDAHRDITGELSLSGVLRRIVVAARDLVQARYAALGVVGPEGQLEQFVHVGMDQDVVTEIGELPKGRGLLGALIDHPQPVRLTDLAQDSRSSGFPHGHPAMGSFLGVPIRSRNEVFGNLYLTKPVGSDFSEQDEELVLALAATAGIAIENARLYEESARRRLWLHAAAEISAELLEPTGQNPLQVIADHAKRLADADVVAIVVPVDGADRLRVAVATGDGEDELRGLEYPVEHSVVAMAMKTGRGLLIAADHHQRNAVNLAIATEVGPLMTVPLAGRSGSQGALTVGRRRGRPPFSIAELAMAEAFATHAAIAKELVDARGWQQRLAVLEERDRIARDLHDHVIQRLFAAGLSVQSIAAVQPDAEQAPRLRQVVREIDDTIRQVRTSIFRLRDTAGEGPRLRAAVLGIVGDITLLVDFEPGVQFAGPLDTLVHGELVDEVRAVVREALTNVARHARATAAQVCLSVQGLHLVVDVTDNGVGLDGSERRSGLDNLRRRAEQLSGSFTVGTGPAGGTVLRWTIPLPP